MVKRDRTYLEKNFWDKVNHDAEYIEQMRLFETVANFALSQNLLTKRDLVCMCDSQSYGTFGMDWIVRNEEKLIKNNNLIELIINDGLDMICYYNYPFFNKYINKINKKDINIFYILMWNNKRIIQECINDFEYLFKVSDQSSDYNKNAIMRLMLNSCGYKSERLDDDNYEYYDYDLLQIVKKIKWNVKDYNDLLLHKKIKDDKYNSTSSSRYTAEMSYIRKSICYNPLHIKQYIQNDFFLKKFLKKIIKEPDFLTHVKYVSTLMLLKQKNVHLSNILYQQYLDNAGNYECFKWVHENIQLDGLNLVFKNVPYIEYYGGYCSKTEADLKLLEYLAKYKKTLNVKIIDYD